MNTTMIRNAALSLLTVWTLATVNAAEQDDSWHFGVTVPIWAAGINGDITVRGVESDVDVSFDELTDHLDASFALGLEARKGRFGLYTSAGYMKFSADAEGPRGGEADFELKILIADAGVSYRLVHVEGEHPFVLEGIAGVRYWNTKTELEISGPLGNEIVDDDDSKDLFDPIVGLRGSQYITRKLHLDFQGDIGGFGISDESADLDWSAAGLVSYDVARWLTLSAGYKALALDMEDGSGSSKKGLDIIMHGVLIAAKFQF